ncbi:hypothetical protein B0T18DRAFT_225830 [Schizothecium vesticola]|uniref:Uncharacterized protein n=1 Tax=Schizothecium vesticola TaxID=314040 RepID=A0AA40EKT7_9PEZI|nr:hypothetical protein B0T18DRAFT_225830 [Schizothecium vesticola]
MRAAEWRGRFPDLDTFDSLRDCFLRVPQPRRRLILSHLRRWAKSLAVIHHGALEALPTPILWMRWAIVVSWEAPGPAKLRTIPSPPWGQSSAVPRPKCHRVKMNNGVFAGSRLHPGFAAASWLGGLEAPGGVVGFACPRMPGGRLAANLRTVRNRVHRIALCGEPSEVHGFVQQRRRRAQSRCPPPAVWTLPLAFTEYRGQRQGA